MGVKGDLETNAASHDEDMVVRALAARADRQAVTTFDSIRMESELMDGAMVGKGRRRRRRDPRRRAPLPVCNCPSGYHAVAPRSHWCINDKDSSKGADCIPAFTVDNEDLSENSDDNLASCFQLESASECGARQDCQICVVGDDGFRAVQGTVMCYDANAQCPQWNEEPRKKACHELHDSAECASRTDDCQTCNLDTNGDLQICYNTETPCPTPYPYETAVGIKKCLLLTPDICDSASLCQQCDVSHSSTVCLSKDAVQLHGCPVDYS